jgi:hypothetical protein
MTVEVTIGDLTIIIAAVRDIGRTAATIPSQRFNHAAIAFDLVSGGGYSSLPGLSHPSGFETLTARPVSMFGNAAMEF